MAFTIRLLLLAALLGLGSAPARAGTVVVDYDLAGTTLDVTNPIALTVPSDQISGSMQLAFASDDLGNILLDGASSVSLLAFDVALNLNLLGGLITGPVSLSLLAAVDGGSLASDGTVSFAGAPDAQIDTQGTVSCNGSAFVCGFAGLAAGANPISALVVTPFADLLLGSVSPFDPALANPLAATLPVSTPVVGVLNLVGSETGRTLLVAPVPEPGTFLLLSLGLLGLGLYGRPRGAVRA